jgi:hypothetical protein
MARIHAADKPNFVVGEPCSSSSEVKKPRNFYCVSQEKYIKEKSFTNKSGKDIPMGYPVSVASRVNETLIRMTDPKLDDRIIGISQTKIPNGESGVVWIGDGRADSSDENQIIPNFDTSRFKKDQLLYVGDDGHITSTKPPKPVLVGRVSWVGKAEPDSYTLNIGHVQLSQVSTWQQISEGDDCGLLTDDQIPPDLICNGSNFRLEQKNPKQTVGDFAYEKTGFNPDANGWALIAVSLFLIGLTFFAMKDSSKSLREALVKTSISVLVLALVIVSLVALLVNIIEPLLRHNPVDFSKKVFGVPQYFLMLPAVFAIIVRNRK